MSIYHYTDPEEQYIYDICQTTSTISCNQEGANKFTKYTEATSHQNDSTEDITPISNHYEPYTPQLDSNKEFYCTYQEDGMPQQHSYPPSQQQQQQIQQSLQPQQKNDSYPKYDNQKNYLAQAVIPYYYPGQFVFSNEQPSESTPTTDYSNCCTHHTNNFYGSQQPYSFQNQAYDNQNHNLFSNSYGNTNQVQGLFSQSANNQQNQVFQESPKAQSIHQVHEVIAVSPLSQGGSYFTHATSPYNNFLQNKKIYQAENLQPHENPLELSGNDHKEEDSYTEKTTGNSYYQQSKRKSKRKANKKTKPRQNPQSKKKGTIKKDKFHTPRMNSPGIAFGFLLTTIITIFTNCDSIDELNAKYAQLSGDDLKYKYFYELLIILPNDVYEAVKRALIQVREIENMVQNNNKGLRYGRSAKGVAKFVQLIKNSIARDIMSKLFQAFYSNSLPKLKEYYIQRSNQLSDITKEFLMDLEEGSKIVDEFLNELNQTQEHGKYEKHHLREEKKLLNSKKFSRQTQDQELAGYDAEVKDEYHDQQLNSVVSSVQDDNSEIVNVYDYQSELEPQIKKKKII